MPVIVYILEFVHGYDMLFVLVIEVDLFFIDAVLIVVRKLSCHHLCCLLYQVTSCFQFYGIQGILPVVVCHRVLSHYDVVLC